MGFGVGKGSCECLLHISKELWTDSVHTVNTFTHGRRETVMPALRGGRAKACEIHWRGVRMLCVNSLLSQLLVQSIEIENITDFRVRCLNERALRAVTLKSFLPKRGPSSGKLILLPCPHPQRTAPQTSGGQVCEGIRRLSKHKWRPGKEDSKASMEGKGDDSVSNVLAIQA